MLERHKLPKLIQGEINLLHKPLSILKIESINYLPKKKKKKTPGIDGINGEFY